jgi:hypothetical protein
MSHRSFLIFFTCTLTILEGFMLPIQSAPIGMGAAVLPMESKELSVQSPLLLLNLDINKTLIAEDLATNKSMEYILTNAILEKCVHQWSPYYPEMSYRDYVEKVLVPGPNTMENKEQRRAYFKDFFIFLESTDYPGKEDVIATYQRCMEKMQGKYLIPSFVKLVKVLKEQKVAFKIILRTFGNDIRVGKITQEIEALLDNERFTQWGKFKRDSLTLNQSETIRKTEEIYRLFREAEGHIAIQDSWHDWSRDDEHKRSAKPFIFNPEDREALSLFVDDNINPDPHSDYNIVRPLSLGREPVSMDHCMNRYIYIADTIEAILSENDNYFIDIANHSLLINGYPLQIDPS